MTTGRLEAFSDGVFAVAITLLVLDIRPPADVRDGTELWRRLGDLWPHYAAYVVSFLVIGIVWVNHHAVLELIREVDRQFAFLNLLLLMSVALIPFATAVLADYLSSGGGPAHTAAAAYSAVISLMGVDAQEHQVLVEPVDLVGVHEPVAGRRFHDDPIEHIFGADLEHALHVPERLAVRGLHWRAALEHAVGDRIAARHACSIGSAG